MHSFRSGILFDLDETLIDRRGTLLHYASALYSKFAREIILGEAEFLDTVDELDGHGRAPRDRFFEGLAERALVEWSPERIERHFYDNAWRSPELFPDVIQTLAEIRNRKLPIGIVTNGRRPVQSAKIRNSGLDGYIDAVVISEEFGARKPDPSIFLHMAAILDIDPGSSWYAGDDPVADIEGASGSGFKTAWLERHLPWPAGRPVCYEVKASGISDLLDLIPGAV